MLDELQIDSAIDRVKILRACKRLDRPPQKDSFSLRMVDTEGNYSRSIQNMLIKAEDLEFLSLLGEGSSGKVYKGLHKGKVVACKVLKLVNDETREEFKKEFEIIR